MKLLPERLAAAASFVDNGSVIADVGCDHGLLPHYLLKNGVARFAYLIDVHKGPLIRARENTEKYGLSEKCELVLSDGLMKLPDHIRENCISAGLPDTVIITGMGGPLIQKIIGETPLSIKESVKNWILSPQSLIDEFREWIRTSGLSIIEEKEIRERRKSYVVFNLGTVRKDT